MKKSNTPPQWRKESPPNVPVEATPQVRFDTGGAIQNGIFAGVIGGFACAMIGSGKLTFPIFFVVSFFARAGLRSGEANLAFVISMIIAIILNAWLTSMKSH